MRRIESIAAIRVLITVSILASASAALGRDDGADDSRRDAARQQSRQRSAGRQRPDAAYKKYETRIERHVYKKTPQGELAIHIHYPKDWSASDKRPAIVFFFGGGWTGGTVEQFTLQAHYLAWRGMVAARADYRVRSRHKTTPDKCVEDGKSAVRWLRQNAAKFGIDPDRIVASGGSAGGHVAACTYTTRGLDAEGEDAGISARPNLLVLYNPVLSCSDERIAQRIGSAEMAERLSPNLNLDKKVPPAIAFYGTRDRFAVQGEEFLQLSAKLGNTVELYMADGQPHGFFNRAPWHQRTTFLADRFLVKHGYLQGKPQLELPEGGTALRRIEPGKIGKEQ